MSTKEQGPNRTDKRGDQGAATRSYPTDHQGKAPGQHTGGALNLQNEPRTADDAQERAAAEARKK